MIDLGTLGGAHSSATDINSSAAVAGYSYVPSGDTHAFLWQSGVMTDLGALDGVSSDARAVNDLGQVVGSSTTPGDFHAFLWDSGLMTDLGTLGGGWSAAADVNNLGQVVGAAQDASNTQLACIWESGVMTDLNTLVVGGAPYVMVYANSINSSGQITGYAVTETGLSSFLLTPVAAVPAPGAMLLGMAGVAVTGLLRKRRRL
jgi:probable HAF family extracellular repeat protein